MFGTLISVLDVLSIYNNIKSDRGYGWIASLTQTPSINTSIEPNFYDFRHQSRINFGLSEDKCLLFTKAPLE